MVRYFFCLLLLLFSANTAVNAQADSSQKVLFNNLYAAADKEYGVRQELINGVLFENKNQDALGHPYFLNFDSNRGSVTYRGKHYSNLFLKYDIYDQQVLLLYTFDTVEYKLYLLKEFITEFTIEDKKFINEAFGEDEDATFYQVIGEDVPVKILYYWKKGLTRLDVNKSDKKKFSSDEKNRFLLLNNNLISYSGNRSFVQLFTAKSNTDIKEYLRKNKTKVNKADDHEMELLIEFINTLVIPGNK